MNLCRRSYLFIFSALMLLLLSACSTTKVLTEDQTRLKRNVVTVTNHKEHPEYRAAEINSYIRQKSNTYFISTRKGGWNPFLYIYNWTNGKGKGWDRFVTKLGQAPVVFDPSRVEDSKENMITHLEYLGYYNSSVRDSIHEKNRNTTVYYNVTLGKQYPIKKLEYRIDDAALSALILSDTVNSLVKEGSFLSADLLDKETERSAAFIKDQGYFEFSKNYYFFSADTLSVPDSVLLTVMVKNYTRNEDPEDARPHRIFHFGKVNMYPVSDTRKYRASVIEKIPLVLDTVEYKDITILYDKKRQVRPSILYDMNLIKPGDRYSSDIVDKSYQRFSNLRLYSSVSVELNKSDTNVVDCSIRFLPSKVNGYKVNLEASTNSSGLIGISPEISYYNRNIFRGGEWLSLSVMGNFQFSVKNSTRATEFGANAGLSFPTFVLIPNRYFKNIVPRTDINLTYNFQKRPEYTRNMIGAKFNWNWNSQSRKFYHQIYPLQINIVNLPTRSQDFVESLKDPFVQEAYKNHFDLGLGYNLIFSTDPTLYPKNSFLRTELRFDISGNLLSAFNSLMPKDTTGQHTIWNTPYSQFVRGEISVAYTWKFGKENKQALAVRALGGLGYAYGNSSKMPFERLFWAGGSNSLRGWSTREIGPGSAALDTTFSIPNQTGDMRLEANIEYRFPLFSVLRGAVFFDWGNIWNLQWNNAEQNSSEDIIGTGNSVPAEDPFTSFFSFRNMMKTSSLSAGLGLRVDLNFVVIRFDWGFKVYDPRSQRWPNIGDWFRRGGSSFQFGIGYPF